VVSFGVCVYPSEETRIETGDFLDGKRLLMNVDTQSKSDTRIYIVDIQRAASSETPLPVYATKGYRITNYCDRKDRAFPTVALSDCSL
jgi:hypothetical protein